MRKTCSILLFMLLLTACEYEFTGEYFKEISQTPAYGDILIDLLDQPDTIYVFRPTTFSLHVEVDTGQNLYQTKVFFNKQMQRSLPKTDISFDIDTLFYESGTYDLQVQVSTNTGTGSMADLRGREILVYDRSWTVVLDKSLPEALSVLSAEKVNGQLKITWEKSDKPNFLHYDLYRGVYGTTDNKYSMTLLQSYSDPDSVSYLDPLYIGGRIPIYVQNVAVSGEARGVVYYYDAPFPQLSQRANNDDDSVSLAWTKCGFESNFGSYRLSFADSWKLIGETELLSDTAWKVALPFGDSVELALQTYSRYSGDSWFREYLTDKMFVHTGEKLPAHTYILYSTLPDEIYLIDYPKIMRYSLAENRIIAERELGLNGWETHYFAVSPDGSKLAYSADENLLLLDPATLETLKTIEVGHFFGGGKPSMISLADNGRVALSWEYNYSPNYRTGAVIDPVTEDTLYSFNKGISTIRISRDGQYIWVFGSSVSWLYRDGVTPEYLGSLPFSGGEFDMTDPGRLYTFNQNSIFKYSCSDRTLIDQYDHNLNLSLSRYQVDPVSGRILFRKSMAYEQTTVYILDMDAKKIAAQKNVFMPGDISRFYALFNNELFSVRGYRLAL